MNTFDIRLGMFAEGNGPNGCVLSFRSALAGEVEVWARVPRPRKGQGEPQFEEVCMGRVLIANLAMTIDGIGTLSGGRCG